MPAEPQCQSEPEVDQPLPQTTSDEPAKLGPTGAKGVVGTRRRLHRCTEFAVNGEMKTEVCAVDAFGHELGRPRVVPEAFHRVSSDLLRERFWSRKKGGR